MNIDHEMSPGDSDANTLKDVVEWHNAGSASEPAILQFPQSRNAAGPEQEIRDDRRSSLWSPSAKRFAVIIESRQCLAADRV
jgi:hypothetical protein